MQQQQQQQRTTTKTALGRLPSPNSPGLLHFTGNCYSGQGEVSRAGFRNVSFLGRAKVS